MLNDGPQESSLTSGSRFSLMARCRVMLRVREEKFSSISLRGFSDLCQYLFNNQREKENLV